MYYRHIQTAASIWNLHCRRVLGEYFTVHWPSVCIIWQFIGKCYEYILIESKHRASVLQCTPSINTVATIFPILVVKVHPSEVHNVDWDRISWVSRINGKCIHLPFKSFIARKNQYSNLIFDNIFLFCARSAKWNSVVRLIQQYLKESNLHKTLQTLQVSFIQFAYFPQQKYIES